MTKEPAAEKPPAKVGRYRLLRRLARGGMAEVYVARSYGAHGFEKTVAIKRILPHFSSDPAFVRMMVDEARITVLLSHPNIAQVFEFGEEGGEYFLVMEYVPGQSLSKLIKRMRAAGERMAVLEACFLVVELLQGLHAAHTQTDPSGRPAHIVHRDVSPQNVLISYDGHVKIIDFGIARARDRLERTEVGTIKGKLRYLAPEMIDPVRFAKGGDFDHRVDVFAAGIVLYELIAGRTLFAGESELDVYDAITHGRIPDLAEEGLCEPELMRILEEALARDPDRRYATAEAFADELRAYLYRSDPAFTQKRIAALMDRFFAEEKASRHALEEPDPELASEQRDLNLTSTHDTPSRASRGDALRANETAAARRSRKQKRAEPAPPPVDQAPPRRQIAPDAVTRMVPEPWELEGFGDDADGDATLPGEVPPDEQKTLFAEPPVEGATSDMLSDTTLVSRKRAQGATQVTGEGGELGEDHLTPATQSRLSRRAGRGRGPWIAAAAGVLGVAALLVMGFVLFVDEEPEEQTQGGAGLVVTPVEPSTPSEPVEGRVPLLVNATPKNATVVRAGSDEPPVKVPAVLMVRPGEPVEIVVEAPGYVAHREAVTAPEGEEKVRLDVKLEPLPVRLIVRTVPEQAMVFVDGKPYEEGMTVTPGKELRLVAKRAGYRTAEKTITPAPGSPVETTLVLSEKKREKKTQPARVGKGKLTITTTPYWGRVTIDGETLEETTPLTVELKAGTYDVVVTHPPKGLTQKFRVRVRPGQRVKRSVAFE